MPPFAAPKPVSYVEVRVNILSASDVPSAKSPAPREVLSAAGDLARRTEQHPAPDGVISRALAKLTVADVTEALSELDASTCEESLTRAAAEAFEAAFADSEEERELFAEAAFSGLLVRDRVESVVFAARCYAKEMGSDEVGKAADQTEMRFASVDTVIAQKLARSFTGINPERRASFDDLDTAARERAVWFSLCLDRDGLLKALADGPRPLGAHGAAIERDLKACTLPAFATKGTSKKSGTGRTFTDAESSALYRAGLGTISSDERAFIERRAQQDESLQIGLRESLASDDAADAGVDGSAE